MKWDDSKPIIYRLLLVTAAVGCSWVVLTQFIHRDDTGGKSKADRPVPVEVAPIQQGPIALQRIFSGELKSRAEFVVAPKVSGRIEHMQVNIADSVQRGQVVAELDNDEYVQAVAQARADVEVARANVSEAQSAFEIVDREFKRTEALLKRGIASDSQFDAARQDRLAKQARYKVAVAQVAKAEAALETANIRLGYTQVTAGWTGGDDQRIVAERYVDDGQTVAANTALLLIVELNPITGIFYVTERDYGYLAPGQVVTSTTEAYPGERFTGHIERIAPVFRTATRQARVEMSIDNPDHRLKPGMFIRAAVVLKQVADAVIVPEQALTKRNDRDGVFIVDPAGPVVRWHAVEIGIRDADRVQILDRNLTGQVVTLGQQLVNDGSVITIPAAQTQPKAGAGRGE